MDIDTLRTFADLAETQNFTRTAERLALTQSAVSARIRQLEHRVGAQLFDRRPGGAVLTDEGRRFHGHAIRLLHIWERARFEARPGLRRDTLNLGVHPTLWSDLGEVWLLGLRTAHPDVMFRVELDYSYPLLQQVSSGAIDYALVIIEEQTKSVVFDRLGADALVMVSHRAGLDLDAALADYIRVDWGPVCNAEHAARLPAFEDAPIRMGVATIAMDYVLKNGGCCYVQERLAQPYVVAGVLHPVAGAPRLSRPIYGLRPLGSDVPLLEDARTRIRRMFVSLSRQAVA